MRPNVALACAALAALGALAGGCSSCKDTKPTGPDPFAIAAEPPLGDEKRGNGLVGEFQCNRCHDGTGHQDAQLDKDCVKCHQQITDGLFKASPEALARWRPVVKDLTYAPSLASAGKRLRRGWIEAFLLRPHDLRPNLVSTMPRLALTPDQARDVAAYIAREPGKPAAFKPGDADRGRKVLDTKGCGTCHRMTGAARPLVASAIPTPIDATEMSRAMTLAPDLKHARARFTPASMVAWLRDPKGVKPDTSMPPIPLTEEQARDVTTYLFATPLTDPKVEPFKRLPVLDRPVKFQEVNERVFHRTCWHCHSEPDFAIGDGGPGNSGGFGFKPRGVDLSSYQGVSSGYLDEEGNRKSLFLPVKSGLPRLVESLVARHGEEAGAETGEVRGMPLGLPPLSAEQIQLVETWVAQGRPK